MSTLGLRAHAAELLGRPGPPSGRRLPLAALRMRLDDASRGAAWSLNPDGVLGRGLMLSGGARASFPLRLERAVTLTGRVQLLPHDWRDGRGGVRVAVHTTERDGRRRELWSATLHASDRGRPRGRELTCTIPGDCVELSLSVTPGTPQERAVSRAIWVDPSLVLPERVEPADAAPADAALAGVASPATVPPAVAATAADSPASEAGPEPLVSVLIPVHDPPPHMLADAVGSVTAQTYPCWELCLVDDGSRDPRIVAMLDGYAASDPRIQLARHTQAGGISAATNTALELASGRYVATLDHDDLLIPDALAQVAARIAAEPELDMVYSDEDVVGEAGLIERHLKPGWSPDHMDALMYTCHLGVYRRSLAVGLGGFQSRFDGCQDYDFVLRLTERTDRIAHLPVSLYHWRAHAASTAGGDQAKPYAYLTQPRAIGEHLQRSSVKASVQFSQFPGLHRVVHTVDEATTVALVLAPESADGLAEAVASWGRQSHPNWTAVLAVTEEVAVPAERALREAGVAPERFWLIPVPDHTTSVAALETAARAAGEAGAEQLVLMQAPMVGLTHDWLRRLAGYTLQSGVAAAGPIVISGDGRIAQSGVVLPDGVPLHLHHGSPANAAPPVVYNLSAVSGVLATGREAFSRLGGLDPALGQMTLVDYCLRARALGLRTVIVPDARLRLTVADPAVNDLAELEALRRSWTAAGANDPYYNARYRTDRGDFTLRSYD
jgi:O-antigen biosynthesis protein